MKPALIYIPYRQYGEPNRQAVLSPVEFDCSGMSDNENKLIEELKGAADAMNPIYRNQFCEDTEDIINVLTASLPHLQEHEKRKVNDYLRILHLQNAPWSFLPRKNHLLEMDQEILRAAAEKAGMAEKLGDLEAYLFSDLPLPEKATFYPESLSEEELAATGEEGKRVNTRIVRDRDGVPVAVYNEEYYRGLCGKAAEHLKKARDLTENISFRLYLDAKIEELHSGSMEARRLADYHWIRHDSPIDIVISTAIEVYLDAWKNLKGTAGAAVTVENPSYREFLTTLLSCVPELERNAPWKWRRDTIPEESLPKLKYVDVADWSGEYISSPMTVLAQSLPNDEWVGKNIGTVNMVFINTSRAIFETRIKPVSGDIFPEEIHRRIGDSLFDGNTLHAALHEIGHTTGRQDPNHQGQPSGFFQNEYSALEETRAELFGMWAAAYLRDRKIISVERCHTSLYYMLLSIVSGLRFEPVQAHNIARNLIYHYLLEEGAIVLGKERGVTVFSYDLKRIDEKVRCLLGTIADTKASGDKEGFISLRKKFCYLDPMGKEIEERMQSLPLGTGLIFPSGFDYPAFTEQEKFTLRFRG